MRKRIARYISLALACTIIPTGCASIAPFVGGPEPVKITTLDKAKVYGEALTRWYVGVHEAALEEYRMASAPVQAGYRDRVFPVMSKMRFAIREYTIAVDTWEKTRQRPLDIQSLYDRVLSLYHDLLAARGGCYE